MIIQLTNAEALRMARLAVLASKPVGMGHLQHSPTLQERDVQVTMRTDHNPGIFIDYYQGRMVKFRMWQRANGWEVPDAISDEYESWMIRYPSYLALAEAARQQEAACAPAPEAP